jgi:hypothetical protein
MVWLTGKDTVMGVSVGGSVGPVSARMSLGAKARATAGGGVFAGLIVWALFGLSFIIGPQNYDDCIANSIEKWGKPSTAECEYKFGSDPTKSHSTFDNNIDK